MLVVGSLVRLPGLFEVQLADRRHEDGFGGSRHRDIDRLVRLRLELVLRRGSGLAGAVGKVLVDAEVEESVGIFRRVL
jgi:hypothetical protein